MTGNQQQFKVGDYVLLTSPLYDVFNCKAKIIRLNRDGIPSECLVIDDTHFFHEHFRNCGCHITCNDDTFEKITSDHFNDALFIL